MSKNNGHISIAILDSGLDEKVSEKSNNVLSQEDFTDTGDFDYTGHGTQCFSLINNYLKDYHCTYHISKILDQDNKSNSKRFLDALQYLESIDVDIINMSFSYKDVPKQNNSVKNVINKLYQQNKIIICAAANDNNYTDSIPACYGEVIGVQGIRMENTYKYWYNKNYAIQAVADISPQLCLGKNGEYSLFMGTSKATALMTCFVAKNIHDHKLRDVINLETDLHNSADKNDWTTNLLKEQNKTNDFSKGNYLQLFDEVIIVLKENYWEDSDIFQWGWSTNEIIKIGKVIDIIAERLSISITPYDFSEWDLINVHTFVLKIINLKRDNN